MLPEFDEDRPSITGRKIASNIPPTVPGYELNRPWLKWLIAIYAVAGAIIALAVILTR